MIQIRPFKTTIYMNKRKTYLRMGTPAIATMSNLNLGNNIDTQTILWFSINYDMIRRFWIPWNSTLQTQSICRQPQNGYHLMMIGCQTFRGPKWKTGVAKTYHGSIKLLPPPYNHEKYVTRYRNIKYIEQLGVKHHRLHIIIPCKTWLDWSLYNATYV